VEAAVLDAEASLHEASLSAGAALTRAFLAGAAGEALRQAVAKVTNLNASLDLGLEIRDERLRSLPWETLRLPDPDGAPGEPLALHPRVHLYRAATGDASTPALAIPGPLRILVAIGSPETGGGELLDYEKELARILDAVEPARKDGKAHVQILHRGTVKAIHEALKAERFHVLHLSCHARPRRADPRDRRGGRGRGERGAPLAGGPAAGPRCPVRGPSRLRHGPRRQEGADGG
jgi:hypothetical protein